MVMIENIWLLLFLSAGLGMLVGLQREASNSQTAGIRTFPLITLAGTVCGLLAKQLGGWIIAAGLIAIAALLILGNLHRLKTSKQDSGAGMTTEAAVILMYLVGAYLVFGEAAPAVVLTGIITVLLHFKTTLHGWVDKFGQHDLQAIMQFVIISMVILPVLPDKTFDPYGSLNPRNIWLMVVLIVGISLAGYFLYKFAGEKAGALLGGILGGLISSTATTISYAKMSGKTASVEKLALFIILTASAVSMIRVIAEIGVVAPTSLKDFVFPLGIELILMIVLSGILFLGHRKEKITMSEQHNPAELKSALIFALLYGVISFISAFTLDRFGNEALYAVSVISGLTDLDAITLSTAKMTESKDIDPALGWRLIMVAVLSNLVFKAGLAMSLGSAYLRQRLPLYFGILILSGVAIILLWPH
jgi:uncharacterized membrane protein (DUF4010 family)